MPKTVGRLKDGDLLLAGEANERLPAITSGLVSYYPMDGNIADYMTGYRLQFLATTARDFYGSLFTRSHNYSSAKFRISGRVRCVEAVDWAMTTGIGFRYKYDNAGTPTYTWPTNGRWTLSEIKEWTYFDFEQSIDSRYYDELLPFIQINITSGTAGYKVEYADVVYTMVSSTQITNSNNVFIPDGVSVEETRTNIASGWSDAMGMSNKRPFNTYSHSSVSEVTRQPGVPEPPIEGMNVWKIKDSNPDNYSRFGVSGIDITTELNGYDKEYTASMWIYIPSGVKLGPSNDNWAYQNSTGIDYHSTRGYNSGSNYYGAGSIRTAGKSADTSIRDKWQKMWISFKPLSANVNVTGGTDPAENNKYATFSFRPALMGQDGSNYIYVSALQVEEKSYSTECVNGAIGNGTMELPVNIDSATSAFTLNYWIAPNGKGAADGNSKIELNNFGRIWHYFPCGTDTRRYIWDYTVPSVRTYKDLISSTPFTPQKYEMISIVWDREKTMFYRNGIYWTELASNANCTIGKIDKLIMNYPNGRIRDLSIYNKALSAEEIKKLAASPLSIKKDGNVTSSIIERTNLSPIESLYFPLGVDANSHEAVPLQETNTSYENGAVWIGTGITNWITDGTCKGVNPRLNNAYATARIVIASQSDKMKITTSATGGSVDNFYQVGAYNLNGLTAGKTYTFSAEVYIPSDVSPANVGLRLYEKIGGTTYSSVFGAASSFNTQADTWTKIHITKTTDSTSTEIFGRIELRDGTDGKSIYVRNVQFEESGFPTPFVDGSRGYSRLNYSSSRLRLDKGEFTIMMWIKYMRGTNWQLSGDWGRFYIGAYNNSYFRFSWMENSATTGNVNTQRSIGTSGYTIPKDEWIHVAYSIKEGAFVDIYANGVRYCNWNSAFLLTTPANAFEFNSLSKTDTAYPLDAWVKDMYVVDRALSASEIESIYKTQMKAYKDNTLQIQGQIKEGKVL